MHDNIDKVLDINDLQSNLKEVFEAKGVLTQFTNENLPAPRKSMAVNEAKVNPNKKDDAFALKNMREDFQKQ